MSAAVTLQQRTAVHHGGYAQAPRRLLEPALRCELYKHPMRLEQFIYGRILVKKLWIWQERRSCV